jgi:hypothetical protein
VQAVRDDLTSEFERATRIANNLKTKELNRALQIQENEMNVEFDKRAQLEQEAHHKELESTKLKFCEEMEQIKREHAKEISHLQSELDESKQFFEQQNYQSMGLQHEKGSWKRFGKKTRKKILL